MSRYQRLAEFLKDGDGQLSSMRLAFLGISGNVAVVWTYLSLKRGEVLDIPAGLAGVLVGFAVGKAAQSFGEK